jgi:hypothetical protein
MRFAPQFLLSFALLAACGADASAEASAAAASACEPIREQQLAIRAAEYRPCAAEILASLDTLRVHVQAMVRGDESARERARASERRFSALIRTVGFEREFRSSNPHRKTERWPDMATRAFNSAVFAAQGQYRGAIELPNQDMLGRASREHDRARQAYAQIR